MRFVILDSGKNRLVVSEASAEFIVRRLNYSRLADEALWLVLTPPLCAEAVDDYLKDEKKLGS